jgi:hypothetical protein
MTSPGMTAGSGAEEPGGASAGACEAGAPVEGGGVGGTASVCEAGTPGDGSWAAGAAGACEAGGPADGAPAGGTGSSAAASADLTSASKNARRGPRTHYFFGLGRIESAVPWMNALSFSTSAGLRRLVKSGIPLPMYGPLNTNLSSAVMNSGRT